MLLHQLFYLPQTLYSFAEYKPYEEMEGSLDTVDVVRLSFQQSWSDSALGVLCRWHDKVVLHHTKMVISALAAQPGRYTWYVSGNIYT